MVRRAIGAIIGVAFLLCSPFLAAQTYDAARGSSFDSLTPVSRPVVVAPNRGVALGNFRLHPGISIQGGYDSNIFFEEDLEGLESSAVLHIMPSLRLETPEPRAVDINTNLQLLWEYFPNESDNVRSQSGIDILGDLSVQIAPRGVGSITLYDTIRNFADSPTAPTNETQGHLYNEVGISAALHPGGAARTSRRGFTGSLTAGYGIEIWDEGLSLDRSLVLASLEMKYFFLPKTAVRLRASWHSISYDTRQRDFEIENDQLGLTEAFQDTLVNIDSTPLRATLGVSGLLTRAIDFDISGGYSSSMYDEGENFQSWIAAARLGVFFTTSAHLSAGWQHGYFDSSFSNFYTFDRFYGALRVDAGDWLVGGAGGYERQSFATVPSPSVDIGGATFSLYSTENRVDPVITADFFVAWNFIDWGRLAGYYEFRGNLTDFFITTGRASGPGRPNSSAAQYLKHQVFFAAEFEY